MKVILISVFKLFVFILMVTLVSCNSNQSKNSSNSEYEIVISGARVIDPETGLDAVRNIGIQDRYIKIITESEISGELIIKANGLVAAPGFIDLHMHGQDPYSEKFGVLDGRTTQMDLEAGAWPVSDYYNYKKNNSLSNYGASVSHAGIRLLVMDGINPGGSPLVTHALEKASETGNQWASKIATSKQLDEIDKYLMEGIDDGGLGIGVMVGYYVDASSEGIARTAKVASKNNSFLTTHARYLSITQPSGMLGLQEMVSLSESYDVPLLIHHLPTNALTNTSAALDLVDNARNNGANIIAEVFPYTKGSTFIASRIMDEGFQERTGMDYSDLIWVETGEVLTEETFKKYRKERPEGMYIMEHIQEKDMKAAIFHPDVILGSDGMVLVDNKNQLLPFDTAEGKGFGHPRTAGTYARYLRMALDDGSLSLPQIFAKTSYLPARFLEEFAPDMKERGRLQNGKVADIILINPAKVQDNASFEKDRNSIPSMGFEYVLVNGKIVVDNGKLVENVFPGEAIRGLIKE